VIWLRKSWCIQYVKKLFGHFIILILYIEFHMEGEIFFGLFIYHSIAQTLYFIIPEKNIKKKFFFDEFWKVFQKPLDFPSKKIIWTLFFFLNNSFILRQNLMNYTSFDRENISLHVGIIYNRRKHWWNLKIPRIPEVPSVFQKT